MKLTAAGDESYLRCCGRTKKREEKRISILSVYLELSGTFIYLPDMDARLENLFSSFFLFSLDRNTGRRVEHPTLLGSDVLHDHFDSTTHPALFLPLPMNGFFFPSEINLVDFFRISHMLRCNITACTPNCFFYNVAYENVEIGTDQVSWDFACLNG